MKSWRKHAVIGLVICLLQLSLADVVLSADATAPNPSLTRQRVDQFGVGAIVKVELINGQKFKGSIQSIEDGGFLLAANHEATRVGYDQVAQLKLAKVTYNAKGQTDAAEAKRVAAGLGVGHHIVVKTAEGNEYHGRIVAFDPESLTMLPDHTNAPVRVAYGSMRQLGPNPGIGTWIAIGVLAAIVITVVVIYAELRSNG